MRCMAFVCVSLRSVYLMRAERLRDDLLRAVTHTNALKEERNANKSAVKVASFKIEFE